MELTTILYFLPCMVATLWFFSFAFKVRDNRQTLWMWVQALHAFYFATYAFYITPNTDYDTLVKMDAVNLPLILALLAMIVVYLHMRITGSQLKPTQILMLLPAMVVGTIVNLLYYIIGFDKAAKLIELADKGMPVPHEYQTEVFRIYNFFSEPFVNVCATIFIIIILCQTIMIHKREGWRFGDFIRFFGGSPSTPGRIISRLLIIHYILFIPMMVLGRRFIMHNPTLGISLTIGIALCQHLISYIEFYCANRKQVTLHELSHLQITGIDTTTEAESEQGIDNDALPPMTRKMTEATTQLRHLLEEERLYLDENINLDMLSKKLALGRTSLSMLISNIYGMPFRDVVSRLRIEEAKRYMLANPKATQEVVASHCGFKNAQYLNTRFKELVGETPAMWLASGLKV